MAIEKATLAEKNNITVYNATTAPKKPKRRDKSDLGPNFVAPDGGWGWVVCIAAGLSNFSLFPPMQQFGLIYRQRMVDLGFTAKETTTIINDVMSLSSIVGIVNGAMFRRFTFRQVAITGNLLAFSGILLTAWATTFWQYIFCLSMLYGCGLGLNMVSTSLAVNTYFKNRRRRATGFTWTITGLGPIIFPHISTMLLVLYGAQGTILIFAAIALNGFVCALTYQPVLWHTKKPKSTVEENANDANKPLTPESEEDEYKCKYCLYKRQPKRSIFSSQYLFNEDDLETPGYEITEPGTPMMAAANDGWYGSKLSLAAEMSPTRLRKKVMRQASIKAHATDPDHHDESQLSKPNYFNRMHEEYERYTSKTSVYSKSEEFHCTCAEEKALMQKISDEELKREQERLMAEEEAKELAKSKMNFLQKVVIFFDLDLLRDFTFVNLVLGMTIMMFAEMNFSVLTPFILNEYGFDNKQISLAMSVLGGMDICVRFLAPFAVEKVKLDNRVLFAFGIIAIAIGRMFVALSSSYYVILVFFVLIGFGKAFRTIFSPLIIPSYVPLKRLPAASGLQLVFNTLFSLAAGPVLGVITDATSYTTTIHVLNLLTVLALLLWVLESVVRRMLGKKAKTTMEG
ncbi:monocarboxylate transporter 9 [Bactrocera tryoni]|uniref:monocarboxylate transporter 9 n=1 Tax=Bactrocera tryoni TaxID=59916 RepID=UPI001A9804E4|nr:monocarboxylate transporter 9 [Bactrocera tryoni]XP_039958971.1 monocarboxylate transporter 9 [Bactrocera tryoni]XP_039958972.1 monocarboxylate transporter 9 [Bactrocera tryoni]XP_039958973.1 monocarboxylate transporter 9 [Bactrocera tryoni]